MIHGIGTGVFWALETIVFALVLSKGGFTDSPQAIFLAPFVAAFLNDTFSNLWLLAFRKSNKYYRKGKVWDALKKKNGRLLILSGLFGGPLGMSAYLLAIKYVGTSYAAALSALFPVIGSIIAWVFFKERLSKIQMSGIVFCTFGVIGMAGFSNGSMDNAIYLIFALTCALFWGLEGVISSYAMKDGELSYEIALQIRHMTSVVCYSILFLPILKAWGFTLDILKDHRIIAFLLLTALLETISYLLYYKAFSMIGAPKAMSLNVTYIMWSILFGVILFRQYPSVNEIISILILMFGIILVALFERGREERVV